MREVAQVQAKAVWISLAMALWELVERRIDRKRRASVSPDDPDDDNGPGGDAPK